MILFQTDSVDMPELDLRRIRRWLREVAASYGKSIGELCYCFCSDDVILDYNRKYLNHDYFTDIITFDYTESDMISGDIVLSLETVASNATDISAEYQEELLRVIVHGVLHLCGIDDKGPGEREIMEAAENKALQLYNSIR